MNKIANTALWGKWLIIIASLILCVGMGASQALAVSYSSTGNNFTMLDADGAFIGGTNDVAVTWDGTLKTSVAVSGQVSNATISSTCPFFGTGLTWAAHDVAIYGPGTYTIYDGCPARSPGCGVGTAVDFTVGPDEIGGHMLFLWNGSDNIDVVNVWKPGVFAPSQLCILGNCGSRATCGANPTGGAAHVWDWMSTDWGSPVDRLNASAGVLNGVPDNINGNIMTDGPFSGSNANFNWMAVKVLCDELSKPTSTNPPCTEAVCNENTLQWEIQYPKNPCDDGNPCTLNDTCLNGSCQPGTTPNTCDDNIQCTADTCDSATGCSHVSHCRFPTEPTLISPEDGAAGLRTTLELRWTRSTDPDGDPITYHITYCKTPNAEGCASIADVADSTLAKRDSKGMFYAGGASLLMIGMTFIGGIKGRKKIIVLLIIVVLFAGGAFMSCKNTKNADSVTPLAGNQVNYMVQGLDSGATYYWKVSADDGFGDITSSSTSTVLATRNFATQ